MSTFSGLPQYERIKFTDGGDWFKSAFFVYRANHGQWNTGVGQQGQRTRAARASSTSAACLPPEAQRRFAEVTITAFLEATLNGKREYLPLFRDHRVAGGWLPKTMYTTRFEESTFRAAADFEDDVDVTTGNAPGIKLTGDSLATWKEALVPFRSRNSTQFHNAAWIGWNNRIAGDDTTKMGRPAAYEIALGDSLRSAWRIDRSSALVFSLAATDTKPGPRQPAKDTTKKDTTAKKPHRPVARRRRPRARIPRCSTSASKSPTRQA